MARLFDDANFDHVQVNAAAVTAAPFTVSCWFRADQVTLTPAMFWIGNSAASDNYWVLQFRGDQAGDPIDFTARNPTSAPARTTTGATLNKWHHACGIEYSAISRACFIDGGSKGTNSTSVTPTGANRMAIGRFADSSPTEYWSGALARVAIWNEALSDEEVLALARGESPLRIRLHALKGYWRLLPQNGTADDYLLKNHMFATALPDIAIDPAVLLPESTIDCRWLATTPAAAAATGRITATQSTLTYAEKRVRFIATQAGLTYSEKRGRVVATQAGLSYTEKRGRIVATQSALTYSEKRARATALQAALTYGEKRSRFIATQASLTYNEKRGRVTATQAALTYAEKRVRFIATQAALTYSEKRGRIVATQAALTYAEKRGRVVATQAGLTYTTKRARVTAAQVGIVYTVVGVTQRARIHAMQALLTYNRKRGRIVATQATMELLLLGAAPPPRARLVAVQIALQYSAPASFISTAPAVRGWGYPMQTPLYLQRGQPPYLTARVQPRPHMRGPRPEQQAVPAKMMALLWASFDFENQQDVTKFLSDWALKGNNFAVWRTALTDRILARGGNPGSEIEEDATRVRIRGEACLDLASMFDVVFLGFWWPRWAIESAKTRSTVGTKFYLWADWESQAQGWNAFQPFGWETWWRNGLRVQCKTLIANGKVLNAYSCYCIDKFEAVKENPAGDYVRNEVACGRAVQVGVEVPPDHAGSPGHITEPLPHYRTAWGGPVIGQLTPFADKPGHTFDYDVWYNTTNGQASQGLQMNLLAVVKANAWQAEHLGANGRYVFDGLALDNLLETPDKGQATNSYPTNWTGLYRLGWLAWLETLRVWAQAEIAVTSPATWVWAAGPLSTGIYPTSSVAQRYLRHFFRGGAAGAKTFAELDADLTAAALSGVKPVLGVLGTADNAHLWATTAAGPDPGVNGTWAQLLVRMRELGLLGTSYVAAWQALPGGYAYWQEGFREPS